MRSLYATVNKSILVASEYPYMRTRLLLPETAVPVQDDGKQCVHEYNLEHHDRAS